MIAGDNEFVLDLYRAAKRLPHFDLRSWIFGKLQQLVHFDSALRFRWAGGGPEPPIHACFAYRQPDGQLAEYLALELWRDDATHASTAAEGRPGSTRISRIDCGSERVRRFWKRYGQEHALVSWVRTEVPQVFDGVSLHRNEAERPFSDEEAARMEQLMPHVADAWRESWLREAARSASSEPGSDGFSIAVLMPDLSMSDAQSDFADILRLEWPRWFGPTLPAELKTHFEESTSRPWSGKSITVYLRGQPDGTHLLLARRVHRLDGIAPRKREVALLFSRGASQTQIARQLQLSPSTVNNYIGIVYEALALRDKTDLSRLVLRLEP